MRDMTAERSPYGKKGGTSVNAGKTAVVFEVLAGGAMLKKRFFQLEEVCEVGELMTAALLTPMNGHPWIFWEVAMSEEALPDYVKRSLANDSTSVVIRKARRIK